MNDNRLLLAVTTFLGVNMVACVIGILYLASANPARSIPDVLVGLVTGILGLFGGILIPAPRVGYGEGRRIAHTPEENR